MLENRFQSRFSATAIIFLSVIFLSGCQTTKKNYQNTAYFIGGSGKYSISIFLKDVQVKGEKFCVVRGTAWNKTPYKIKYRGSITLTYKQPYSSAYYWHIFGYPYLTSQIPILMPQQRVSIKGMKTYSRQMIKRYPNLFTAADRYKRNDEELIPGSCDPYYEISNLNLCLSVDLMGKWDEGKVISPCFELIDKSGNVKAYEKGSWKDEPIIKLNILPYDEYHKGYQKNTNDTGKWLKTFKPSKGGFWKISPY